MVFSAIPQVVTEDRASGAHIVDGILKIDNDKTNICVKHFPLKETHELLLGLGQNDSVLVTGKEYLLVNQVQIYWWIIIYTGFVSGSSPIDAIRIQQQDTDGNNNHFHTNAAYRDTVYHIVMRVDTTSGTPGDRLRLYVNGELQSGIYSRCCSWSK